MLLPPLVCPQWLCVPFVFMNPASVDITATSFNHTFQAPWVGSLTASTVWKWLDIFLLLVRWTAALGMGEGPGLKAKVIQIKAGGQLMQPPATNRDACSLTCSRGADPMELSH